MPQKKKRLEYHCRQWSLKEPVHLVSTFTSEIHRVIFDGQPAVLKILNENGKRFESRGSMVLRCFDGNGAVRLFKADEDAHLLEYIEGRQLRELVVDGDDDQATEIISQVATKLHSYRGPTPAELISMERHFRSLFERAKYEALDSVYVAGAQLAENLIASEQEMRVLHGDIHHENVLESTERGWLAIDPQCLFGERTYDLANAFYNPTGFSELARRRETIERRCALYSKRLHLDRRRLLEFAFAYGCLSAAWCIEDGQSAEKTLRIAESIRRLL